VEVWNWLASTIMGGDSSDEGKSEVKGMEEGRWALIAMLSVMMEEAAK